MIDFKVLPSVISGAVVFSDISISHKGVSRVRCGICSGATARTNSAGIGYLRLASSQRCVESKY